MKIYNKKATFDYVILDKMEVGIILVGAEVKAFREGHADLTGSFVRILGYQAYLISAKIFPYKYARPEAFDEKRTRKLLMHKKEIISLKSKMDGSSLTVVPTSMYTTHSKIKVEIALAKAKKKFEKREDIKKKDMNRDIQQALKGKK